MVIMSLSKKIYIDLLIEGNNNIIPVYDSEKAVVEFGGGLP